MVTPDGSVYDDHLVTYVHTPGYRSIGLEVEINRGTHREKVLFKFNKENAVAIMEAVKKINETAWSKGKPNDAEQGEQKPDWL